MKRLSPKPQAFTLVLTLTALTAGCAGPTNNTQRGAAGGAALGALAGAVIGHNRGSGNTASGAAIGAAAGAIAGGAIGHSRDKSDRASGAGTFDTAESQAMTNIVVSGPPPFPPVPIVEKISARPSSSAVWIPGYWSYENGSNYAWMAGHWEIPPQGYRTFQPPYWVQRGGNHVYVRGHWR